MVVFFFCLEDGTMKPHYRLVQLDSIRSVGELFISAKGPSDFSVIVV